MTVNYKVLLINTKMKFQKSSVMVKTSKERGHPIQP